MEIAIVGTGCRLPGGANRPEAFWRLLCEGIDAVTEVAARALIVTVNTARIGTVSCAEGSAAGGCPRVNRRVL
jgi:hypothetical protein